MLQTTAIVWMTFLAGTLAAVPMTAPSMHQGRIAGVSKGEVMVVDAKNSEPKTFLVTAETRITVDTKPAKLVDLQTGFTAEITAEQSVDGKLTATTIVASSKISPKR